MPHLFTNAYIVVGSICGAVSLLHLLIFIRRRAEKIHAIFAFMALCCAVSTMLDIHMHGAVSVAEFVRFYKATNTFQVFLWISFAWFIRFYAHSDRRWPVFLVSGLYGLSGTLNLAFSHGILFDRVDDLNRVMLPWGETITFGLGPATPWRLLPDLAWFIVLAYALDSSIGLYRRGEKQRAWFFGLSVFACLGIGYLHGTLIDLGVLPPPSIWLFTFLALIILMSVSLVDDVVSVPVLKRQISSQMEKWKTLVDNANMLVFGLDTGGRINFVNPHFLHCTGYTEDEIIGRSLVDIARETEKEEVGSRIQKALENGDLPGSTQRALVTKNGIARDVHWAHVLLRDPDGKITGTLSIGDDVTEVRQAQRALADEKARMDVVLSNLNTGLALLNRDLTVLWVNAKTRQAYPWDDPVGKKCFAFAENRSEPCEGCGALLTLKDGEIHETERLNLKNNRWYLIISMPIKGEDGQVIQILESSTDITERKLLETARDQAIQELETLKNQLEEENLQLKEDLLLNKDFEEIVGQSNAILYVLERVKQVAQTDATVLIQGETGVGKELIAGAIHRSSQRAGKPFVRLNCAALAPNLIESELFGHEAGAFTGARRMRKGRFEMADGGTLLLDEVSELPLELQAKLLRVLQEGQFERVGGSATHTVDVRVIATTNRILQDEVENGKFRADLFYRLKVYPITVPPLGKRRDDIESLVWHFLEEINARVGKTIRQIPPSVMQVLIKRDYPGNVRELKNMLEHAVITSDNGILQLPTPDYEEKATVTVPQQAVTAQLVSLDDAQRLHITHVLDHTDGRIEGPDGAAEILGLKPSTLRHRIKKLGIQRNH
jgi:PAS domain S-box-containing protein